MHFLYELIVLPIETVFEFIFCFFVQRFEFIGIGGAIFAVSLAVNFMALPLYNIADEIQLKERMLQKKLSAGIKRIKTAFKGDEQFMMISTFYRQNHYHPFFALRSALSILIEIPFFIAAYHFLSNCAILKGASFLFLKNLGAPDNLFSISGFSVNILPVIMTLVNAVSTAIYTKDAPLREKIQTYALALVFLVLLYNSPSGLVFYWILNNLFSLAKNVVLKMKHPGKVLYYITAALLCLCSACFMIKFAGRGKVFIVLAVNLIVIVFPFVLKLLKSRNILSDSKEVILPEKYFLLAFSSCLMTALLAGLLIPSNIISTSPVEFSFIGDVKSPFYFVKSSFLFFAGSFLLWPVVIYKMFGAKVKKYLGIFFVLFGLFSILNTYVFSYHYGTIDLSFKVENYDCFVDYSVFYSVVPVIVLLIIAVLLYIAFKFNKTSYVALTCFIISFAELSLGLINMNKINKSYREFIASGIDFSERNKMQAEFNLSRDKENVLIFLLDRAISDYFPTIIKNIDGLEKSFDGFTYYPNCISFGESTVSGSPALVGGYDYTPEEINSRPDETLKEKQNEAIKVMPKIFSDAGYSVVFADPPWMNYQGYFDDRGVFDGIDGVKAVPLESKFGSRYIAEHKYDFPVLGKSETACAIALKHFTVVQMMYPAFRGMIYHDGNYYVSSEKKGASRGLDYFAELYYLPLLTKFESEKPTWTFIYNETPHEYQTMYGENFVPGNTLDESKISGTLGYWKNKDSNLRESFHVNAASLIQVGKYLDYLRENNCYDNTRIIIVADHGRSHVFNCFSHFKKFTDVGYFNPLLLFKDFNSAGPVKTDDSFVSNAETVNLAVKNLNVSDVNPYTRKKFRKASDFKSFNVYEIFSAGDRNAFKYKDHKVFPIRKGKSYTVRDNIFEEKNWERK